MYGLIEEAYEVKNSTNAAYMSIRIGYYGTCIQQNDADNDDESLTCDYTPNLDLYNKYQAISLYGTSDSDATGSLDIVGIATSIQEHVIKPYLLWTSIILNIILFVFLFYCSFPFVPYREAVKNFSVILSLVLTLIWAVGAMWAHIAIKSGVQLVEPSSMYIIEGNIGSKSEALTWTSFTFYCIVSIFLIILHIDDIKVELEIIEPKV
ncbi:Fig1 domain-containing protein ASCRUDRAFT_73302 [Ascoidea rubescens DSM 1968]|uniref:MARVEL domain-containing protein n=1 Tax=Ascoidea rubescens DSM 1968 TaxID=1344418 RepID=A0A1D2VPB7_9ASCO|nr:hypothetical protein ASCRUDRAFT_73302 [Ascoidea rubescens DSM 1968]ODV63446.1 hypothetical protein ASCRUDRAFT_73302 [Ascoidea rubescens DSM 1968]